MAITPEEIRHLATLSRLKLDEEQIPSYAEKLDAIVGYVDKLRSLKTDGIPEMQHAETQLNVLRGDAPVPCDADERERAITAFPRREGLARRPGQATAEGDLLAVNAVFEERSE